MKLLNNFHQKHLVDDATTLSLKSCCEQESTKASQINLHLDENSTELRPESCSDFISTVFSEPELPRLCKFESEDSGVELPSGANSPSTPSASEQSFVVHSRKSSCDSCNSKPDSTLCPYTQNSETREMEYLVAADPQDLQPEEHSSSTTTGDLQEAEPMDIKTLVISPERGEDVPEKLREDSAVTEGSCCECTRQCGKECAEITGHQLEPEPLSSESLEEYMDHCCRISQVRWSTPCIFLQLLNWHIFSYVHPTQPSSLIPFWVGLRSWKASLSSNFRVYPGVFVSVDLRSIFCLSKGLDRKSTWQLWELQSHNHLFEVPKSLMYNTVRLSERLSLSGAIRVRMWHTNAFEWPEHGKICKCCKHTKKTLSHKVYLKWALLW